jgi:hypothetical protein
LGAESAIATRDCTEPGDDDPRRGDHRDHVHMLVSITPTLSVSKAVQFLKGKSSHKLLSEYASLQTRYRGQHLRRRRYWVVSSGNVTDDLWAGTYRGSKARDARRPIQGCAVVDPRGRPNPTSSRNLKPPALAGGCSPMTRKLLPQAAAQFCAQRATHGAPTKEGGHTPTGLDRYSAT